MRKKWGTLEIGLIISKATNSPCGDFLCLGMKILVMYLLKHYFGTIVLKKNTSYSFSLLCMYKNNC